MSIEFYTQMWAWDTETCAKIYGKLLPLGSFISMCLQLSIWLWTRGITLSANPAVRRKGWWDYEEAETRGYVAVFRNGSCFTHILQILHTCLFWPPLRTIQGRVFWKTYFYLNQINRLQNKFWPLRIWSWLKHNL